MTMVDIAVTRELIRALEEAEIQLMYLDGKYPTGTTPPVLVRVRAAIAEAKKAGY